MSPSIVLWDLVEVVVAVRGIAGVSDRPLTGISIDSRSIAVGDLFIALRGPHFDGHDFVQAALDAGAAAAIVADDYQAARADAPLIRVADTQIALEDLGRAARARSSARIIAVTGSVGKTSTKEMLAVGLGELGPTHASGGSLNNHWGVPLSLARMPRTSEYAVFELGMNHAGEIAGLVAQVRPHVALITTIEAAHLEFFADLDAIADAKAEIFSGVEADGVAILNRDNPQFARLEAVARHAGIRRVVGFGIDDDAAARLLDVLPEGRGSHVDADISGFRLAYSLGLAGRHMALNSVAVLAAVAAVGGDTVRAASGFKWLSGLAGRGRRVEIPAGIGTATLLDESYNASPASIRAALAVLADIQPGPGGRRIAVLGDMRELGAAGPDLHRDLAAAITAAHVDKVYTAGPLMAELSATLDPERRGAAADNAALLLPHVVASLRAGDVVMVKGSNGMRLAEIVKTLIAGVPAGGVLC